MLVPKESPSLHHHFFYDKHWKQNKIIYLSFKHAFYFLSLFKNHVSINVNYLIQWNICEQRLNVKRFHKKIWILINDFITKWKRILGSIFIDCKLLQCWYKIFCKVVITITNCKQNWMEPGYVIVMSYTFTNFAKAIQNTWFTATWF